MTGGESDSYPRRYRADPWVEYWFRMWERAYTEHHPLVASYALARGSLRALRIDLASLLLDKSDSP